MLDSDWVADQILKTGAASGRTNHRLAISRAIRDMVPAQAMSGRRYPFKWFRGRNGAPTRYAMKPSVAALFRAARNSAASEQNPAALQPDSRGEDWTNTEVKATIGDYLEMLSAEIAGKPYSEAEHRGRCWPG